MVTKTHGNARDMLTRFWEKVEKTDTCWVWIASTRRGYGRFRIGDKKYTSHRVSWEIYNGEIPDGMCVLHHCDNPPCVNPDHLFIGTQTDNIRDRHMKGRNGDKTGINNGRSVLDENDVIAIRHDHHFVSRKQLSRKYGVSISTICSVINLRTWKSTK